jgi:hypothetical protein
MAVANQDNEIFVKAFLRENFIKLISKKDFR